MHITLIISALTSGGAERVISELANYWASDKNQVTLLTLASPGTKPFYPLNSHINLLQLDQCQNEISLFKRFRNILKRVLILRKTLKNLKPDVILSFVDVMNITALQAAIKLRTPVIVSERTHPSYHKLPALYAIARKIFYPQACKVVVQTNSVAKYFNKLKNIITIANAVTKPSMTKIITSDKGLNIVSVGRLCPFKGFDILIRAFANIHDLYTDLRLIIYGEGVERENLEKLIESLHLQQKVFLPGITRDIDQALLQADLFVFPSQYEGFPNALCEAMAIGLPVIASDCSGNVDIVRDCIDGRLFPVGDVNRLTELLQELVNDTEQRKRLGSQAQEITERFSHKHIFKMWDEVIENAVINKRL